LIDEYEPTPEDFTEAVYHENAEWTDLDILKRMKAYKCWTEWNDTLLLWIEGCLKARENLRTK